MEHVIEIKHLNKNYDKTQALDSVSFQVEQGEIFGLLGPSGSGKTTMIKLLTGELTKTSGQIKVLNQEEKYFNTSDFKSEIGVLSDNSALYERLTVYDNLKLVCKLYQVDINEIDHILEQVNLIDAKKKTVSKLSKGMKQRVLLAKTLIHKPKLLFLDEPTSALDPSNIAHIHEVLRKLNREGTTIFLSTHNMEEATSLCNRVALLNNGRIQELDDPKELRFKYATNYFTIETYNGETLVIENKPENSNQIKTMIDSGQVKRMYSDFPTLGEVFLEVTGKELV